MTRLRIIGRAVQAYGKDVTGKATKATDVLTSQGAATSTDGGKDGQRI